MPLLTGADSLCQWSAKTLENTCAGSRQELVTCQHGYHGPNFQVTMGKQKVGLILPSLCNMVVHNFLHNWLSMTVEDKYVAHDGLGLAVGR